VFTTNQFGDDEYDVGAVRELCVPSQLNPARRPQRPRSRRRRPRRRHPKKRRRRRRRKRRATSKRRRDTDGNADSHGDRNGDARHRNADRHGDRDSNRNATPTPTVEPTPACGDGITNGAEDCDDGNTDACDGCSPSARGVLRRRHAMRKRAVRRRQYRDCDGCSSTCTIETCGDGTVCPFTEDCDPPGGTCINGRTCTESCTCPTPFCGDGLRRSDETCDDGNNAYCDGCSATCQIESVRRRRALHRRLLQRLRWPCINTPDDSFCDDGDEGTTDRCLVPCNVGYCTPETGCQNEPAAGCGCS
jgi:cysteine-rich repeat protein